MKSRRFLSSLGLLLALASSVFAIRADGPVADRGRANAQTYAPATADFNHGKSVALGRCAVCHGADGNSANSLYPKLAGQKPDYIFAQLQAFRSGMRASAIMAGMVAGLSVQDADDVAAYYAVQSVYPDRVKNSALAADGRQIYLASMGPGMRNDCGACHGGGQQSGMPGMMGHGWMMGQGSADNMVTPNIFGQHAAYIFDQLNRFASGQRSSSVMQSIAAALDTRERKAVADYLSGQQ